MFDKNILTFNPDLDQSASPLASFTDVRDMQKPLDTQGINITTRVAPNSSGPAHIIFSDPDGNVIMLDQHV